MMMGEPEELLTKLAGNWDRLDSLCYRRDEGKISNRRSPLRRYAKAAGFAMGCRLHWPALSPPPSLRCGTNGTRSGSGGVARLPLPLHVCAKDNFRNEYRRRHTATVLEEIDALIGDGVEYIYFIDEIFIPQRDLLRALADRQVRVGCRPELIYGTRKPSSYLGSPLRFHRSGCGKHNRSGTGDAG